MRRVLSSAVQIKAAPTQAETLAAALDGTSLTAVMPTESQVREGVAKVTADLEDMRLARTDGSWTATDQFEFQVFQTAEGETGVRGYLTVERAD